ncbi:MULTISPECIES: YitT family protein [unclassified Bacillus (in: firmicutes)]|uniref:YitT family protein n=1 Tax=unclassified Bacillus (in: firmicutes) TaxID=185979 RepID=UPI002035B781|nr:MULTISPECIES: YitT family protein [unclassified Bacillus (in: firmicutes)]
MVIAGGTIQGIGMGLFLFPHAIPSGGAGGIAVLLNYFLGIDMGLALWIVNFSMLVVAAKYLGNRCALWTMCAITVTSFTITFCEQYYFPAVRNEWIDLVMGSIFLGTGIGLLLKEGVSNGGVGVIALIIAKRRNSLPGSALFWINCCIFVMTGFIISLELIVQALISQWISTKMVDIVYYYNYNQAYTLGWRKK